jgi:hypothetical protein
MLANSTAANFTAKIPTATEVAHAPDTGIHDILHATYGFGYKGSGQMPQYMQIVPFGGNADNETFSMRLWGWNKVHATALWVPQLLCQLDCTLGAGSGAAVETNVLMVDTIAIVTGTASDSYIQTPANDTQASIIVSLRGCSIVEFDFDLTGTGDQANAYWRTFDTI